MSGTQLYRVSSKRWRSHLSKFQVKDLIPADFKLIHVNVKDKMLDALKLLTTQRIMSAPVWDDEKKDYIGLISMIDLVAAVVFLSDIKVLLDGLASKEVDWNEFIKQENQVLAEGEVGALINVSDREPYSPVYYEFPLLSLMDMFSSDVNIHHVPVNNGNGEVISFISQSRVTEFLTQQIQQFPDLSKRKLKDYKQMIDEPSRKVLSIHLNELALDAFRKMMDENVTGLAVVNDNEQLEGVISISDMKRSSPENIFHDLHLPISEYLDKRTSHFPREGGNSKRPVACVEDDTLEAILDKLHNNRVHRVVVVDSVERRIPQYVVSLSDVISMLELY